MRGRIDLAFGSDSYFELAMLGFFGCIPLVAWGATLATALPHIDLSGRERDLAAGIVALATLALPPVVPCLVLRARDPEAHVEWDDREVREHRGSIVRCTIPLSRASAAHLEFQVSHGRGRRTMHALQIFDDASDAVITVWEQRPRKTSVVRRRLCVASIAPLLRALEGQGIPFTRTFDGTRAGELDRVRVRWRVLVGRFGYVLATLAPLIVPSSRSAGIALGAGGAALLALRAHTSVRELCAVLRTRPSEAPVEGEPYRAVAPAIAKRIDQIKRSAVEVEVVVRASFVLLAIASTLVAWVHLR